MKIQDWLLKKTKNEKISVLTCYDYSFAKIVASTDVDAILVGDSVAMTMHGQSSTLSASTRMMATHVSAVSKGAPGKFLIGDMPFLSFRSGLKTTMHAVHALMANGAHAVKLEGASGNLKLVKHIVESGVPVMGHLGLTPQSIHAFGGYKVQAKSKEAQEKLLQDALDLQEAGCFSVVLECVPMELSEEVTKKLRIPTIGIGAGVHCDGQVLVLQDLLGMNQDFSPKFVRKYLNGSELISSALNQYHHDVVKGEFPSQKESYTA